MAPVAWARAVAGTRSSSWRHAGEGEFAHYEDEPVPVTQVKPNYLSSRATRRSRERSLPTLVGKDGA
jgi:hypothetical protein